MRSGKPRKSLLKRIKTWIISTLLAVVLVESILLYRLYTVHVEREEVTINELGEVEMKGPGFASRVSRLRAAFSDTSADAWAEAKRSNNPEDAWFNIGFRPRADFRDQEDSYHIAIDVPGVNPAELSVSLSGLTLNVTGTRHRSETAGDLLIRERFRGEFARSFDLPGKIRSEGIRAVIDDGILRIVIPKGDSDSLNIPIPVSTG